MAAPTTVRSLHVYPVKGLRGITLETVTAEERGFRWDRRWMVVDAEGGFLSQRRDPRMATVATRLAGAALWLEAPADRPGAPLEIPLPEPGMTDEIGPVVDATLFGRPVQGRHVGETADRWLSAVLETPCRLLYMSHDLCRPVDPAYSSGQECVSFADGYPVLAASEQSLADLNRRLDEPVPMNRFRPNLVVAGGQPFAEDSWGWLRVGSTRLRGVKPCGRCSVTTVDQVTGQSRGPEPLRTLATFRRQGKEVCFGQNLLVDQPGVIEVGDPVERL